jgi:TolB-like protein
MRPWWVEHRRAAVSAIGLLVLVATAIAITWQRSRTRSTTDLESTNPPPVISIAWQAVGEDMEPWSGVGLGEQVRQALNARGIVVTDDRASPAKPTPGGAEALAALGRELSATYVLGGTVGRKGKRSEIGMQLVRVQDGAPVWSSTFWRDPSDLQSLASDLAVAVAQVLETESSRNSRPSP